MNTRLLFLSLLLAVFVPSPSFAAELISHFVDGLGRPIASVEVEVKYPKKGPDEKLKEVEWLKTRSDKDGQIKLEYDETLIPTNETIRISVKKTGYAGFSTDHLKSEHVLKKEFSADDVHRVAALSGEKQKAELQELLVGQLKEQTKGAHHQSLEELAFFHGSELRASLRELIADSKAGKSA